MQLSCIPCLPKLKPKFGEFSTEAKDKWRCSYQWSNNEVNHTMPSIRDDFLEIQILRFEKYPKFLVTALTDIEFPNNLGNVLDSTMRETSDPNELRQLLSFSPNAHLIDKQICDCYEGLF